MVGIESRHDVVLFARSENLFEKNRVASFVFAKKILEKKITKNNFGFLQTRMVLVLGRLNILVVKNGIDRSLGKNSCFVGDGIVRAKDGVVRWGGRNGDGRNNRQKVNLSGRLSKSRVAEPRLESPVERKQTKKKKLRKKKNRKKQKRNWECRTSVEENLDSCSKLPFENKIDSGSSLQQQQRKLLLLLFSESKN